MKIDEEYYTCELEDVLDELINQMRVNNYPYLQKGYKRSGDSLQVQCPFHGDGQERKPSFGIRRSDGMGHCFACGKVVTLPEFITKCFDEDDIIAEFGRRWLRKNFLSLELEERKDVELDYSRNRSSHDNNGTADTKGGIRHSSNFSSSEYVDDSELQGYRYYHKYWTERGIISEDIIELFDLGYDKVTDSITFPVRDVDGNCLFVARRSVKTKWFNYPRSTEKCIYGLYELYSLEKFPSEVWITESMIDALRLWQVGIYACALNGLGSSKQYTQLSKMPCRIFVLATDMDTAGIRARDVIRERVPKKLFMQVFLPKGRKDIGECTDDEILNLKKVF